MHDHNDIAKHKVCLLGAQKEDGDIAKGKHSGFAQDAKCQTTGMWPQHITT